MKLFRQIDHKRMPWKNGGGETVEIAVFPEDAGLSDFDWRVSMATVASDGPFSVFAGIDRTLSILSGTEMQLEIGGRELHVLTTQSEPLAFPADTPVAAKLANGPITDLNVMTRRGRYSHGVRRIDVCGSLDLVPQSSVTILLVAAETLSLVSDGQTIALMAMDAASLPAGNPISLSGKGMCYVISIDPVDRTTQA